MSAGADLNARPEHDDAQRSPQPDRMPSASRAGEVQSSDRSSPGEAGSRQLVVPEDRIEQTPGANEPYVTSPTCKSGRGVAARTMRMLRALVLPLGYLAFVIGLSALSVAARLLGEEHELGFFCGRLVRMLWRYPEVTRRGVQVAWLMWAVLFGLALSPVDPILSPWDEVALGAVALAVLWPRISGGQRAGG